MVSLSFLRMASTAGLPVEWPGHRRTGMARSTLPGLMSSGTDFPPVIIYRCVYVRCSRTRVPAPRAVGAVPRC